MLQLIIRDGIGASAREAFNQNSPNILNENSMKTFWVSWDVKAMNVSIGSGSSVGVNVLGTAASLVNLQTVNAFGVTTANGYPAEWSFGDYTGSFFQFIQEL